MRILPVVSALLLASPLAHARPLPNPPAETPTWDAWSAELTMIPGLSKLSPGDYADRETSFTLANGTVIEGLYFPAKSASRELVIASFGLFNDRYEVSPAEFVHDYVEGGRIADVNVLVLDSATSGTFFAKNHGQQSPAAYDEGQILLEVASIMKSRAQGPLSVRLVGFSRSGIASLHAAAEDERRGGGTLDAVLTFSAPVDEIDSTIDVMVGLFQVPTAVKGTRPTYSPPEYVRLGMNSVWGNFEDASRSEGGPSLSLSDADIGKEILSASEARLAALRASPPPTDPSVDMSTMDKYTVTTAATLDNLANVRIPVVLVHAQNDPLIPYSDFAAFAARYQSNQDIQTYAPEYGSHCGFAAAYGADWVNQLLRRLIEF